MRRVGDILPLAATGFRYQVLSTEMVTEWLFCIKQHAKPCGVLERYIKHKSYTQWVIIYEAGPVRVPVTYQVNITNSDGDPILIC